MQPQKGGVPLYIFNVFKGSRLLQAVLIEFRIHSSWVLGRVRA